MRKLFTLAAAFGIGLGSLMAVGCEQNTADQVGDTAEETTENVQDAGEDVGDAVEDTGDDIGDAVEDATDEAN